MGTPATFETLKGGDVIKRHHLSTRIWHWLSAGMALVLLMSGLMIFNAHPRLYWGEYGANPDPAWLEIGAEDGRGYVRLGTRGQEFETTGFLGLSPAVWGGQEPRAFPKWATLPAYYDLAAARRWHLSFAWYFTLGTIFFGIWSIVNGHMRRDLLPTWRELHPGRILHHCREHAKLRLPCGAAAARYNILQKLFYLGVTAVLIPVIILTGLAMSPRVNSVLPWLTDIFGGRQSARSVHFIGAFLLVGFVLLHLVMVVVAGPINEIRSMITGRFRLPPERDR